MEGIGASKNLSEGMDLSVVCPVEDTILALIDYLVDPMLPAKSSIRDTPSPDQQQSVANQVHAVVILFNYYHRKQHPGLDFQGYESFCKLAAVLRPSLLGYLKLMQISDNAELDDLENQTSVTDKMIMRACDISSRLDALKDAPVTDGWPISKVTVFLVDSEKENCFLIFSSITNGVWSVIEKDLDDTDAKHVSKKRRFTRRTSGDELGVDEAALQQFAFSAIKEASGISQTDLVILEKHVVYSLSKEKATARFYIMQCNQPNNEAIQVPIKDVLESLNGPLVTRHSDNWAVTSVVEYFHILPYAGIISGWLSRKEFSNGLPDSMVGFGDVDLSFQRTENHIASLTDKHKNISCKNGDIVDILNEKTRSDNIVTPMGKEKIGHHMIGSSSGFDGPHNMSADDSSLITLNVDKSMIVSNAIQGFQHPKRAKSAANDDLKALASGVKNKAELVDFRTMKPSIIAKGNVEDMICSKILSDKDLISTGERDLITSLSNPKHVDKLQGFMALEGNILAQTAVQVLIRKRDKLSHQHRTIEDEIALCDRKIQTFLKGNNDDFALKIETIIEGCNDVCGRSATQIQKIEDQVQPHYRKGKRLSEAILNLQNPCQELDGICYENGWALPTYRVSTLDGGFQANIAIKGMDFECSGNGELSANPVGARESAAALLMAKMRSMASQAQ